MAPRLSERMDSAETRELRAEACRCLSGEVLEVGFGSGLNLPYYPPAVTAVTAVEPSAVARRLAARRIAALPAPVVFAGTDAARLPLPDGSFDSALSTLTLCTIPDVTGALAEIHRVLRPGGVLHFFEHGLAPDPVVQRWQRRLAPVQRRVFAGCRLTRDIRGLISSAGFALEEIEESYLPGPPPSRPFVYVSRGRARTPA